MRQVFDRMIATEEQIAAAQARNQYKPLFTDAAMAGMTEEAFNKYKQRQVKVTDTQTETLRDKLVKQLTRTTTEEWQSERQDIIDELMIDLRKEPAYRAIDVLKNGDVKLDRAEVKESHGVSREDAKGRKSVRPPEQLKGMTVLEGGLSPDDVAKMFDFANGDALINAVVNVTPIKERALNDAESIMKERHGDILNDGTIEQLANEALLSDERADLLIAEYKTLIKGTSQKVIERQAMKELAEDSIAKLSYRQIFPAKYRKAEIQASNDAVLAMKSGDKNAAAAAKSRQIMNHYLSISATDAKTKTDKIVSNMSRYNKKAVQTEIRKAGNEYWDQLVKVLGRFEFRKAATLKGVDEVNRSIETWLVDQNENHGANMTLSPATVSEFYRDHWKNIPFDKLQGIADSVAIIEHTARYTNKVTLNGEKVVFSNWKERAMQQLDQLSDKHIGQRLTGRSIEATGFTSLSKLRATRRNIARKLRGANASLTKVQILARWLDSGKEDGMFTQLFDWGITDAAHNLHQLRKEISQPLIERIANLSKADKKRMSKTYVIPETKRDEKDDGVWAGHQLIAVALNSGNPSNLRKMLLGEGWAKDESQVSIDNPILQKLLSHLTQADLDLVQSYFDASAKLYPLMSETSRKSTGVVPQAVDSSAITTANGTIPGGYYVMSYDHARSRKAAEIKEKNISADGPMFNPTGGFNGSLTTGSTIDRTAFYDVINFDINEGIRNMDEVMHYVTHHDIVRQLNKIIRDPDISKAIEEKVSPEDYAQMAPWLMDVAKDTRATPTELYTGNVANRLRVGTTLAYLGYNTGTMMVQAAGLASSASFVGGGYIMSAIAQTSKNPVKAAEFAMEHSKVLQHRVKTYDREMADGHKILQGKHDMLAKSNQMGMAAIGYVQLYVVDLSTWHGAYNKGMHQFEDHDKAVNYADSAVKLTQGSGEKADQSALLRSENKMLRLFTMFLTFFNSRWNLSRDAIRAKSEGRKNSLEMAQYFAYAYGVAAALDMLVRGEFGDDEEEWEDTTVKLGVNIATAPFQDMPVLRGVANTMVSGFEYNASAPLALAGKVVDTMGSTVDGELSRYETKQMLMGAAALLHVGGASQGWKSGEHVYDVFKYGDDFTLRELLRGNDR